MAKRKNKTVYALVGVVVVLAILLTFAYFYIQTTAIPTVTKPDEASTVQQNISQGIGEIKNMLEQLNNTLSKSG